MLKNLISFCQRKAAVISGSLSYILTKIDTHNHRETLLLFAGRHKKYLLRLTLILGILFLYVISNTVILAVQEYFNRVAVITFDLPFPEDIEEKYGLVGASKDLEVKSVVITGYFSGWDANSSFFKMKKTGKHKWKITMNFPQGDNQYKFAVHANNPNDPDDTNFVYWVYDKHASIKVDDSYGGYNSAYTIYNPKTVMIYVKVALLGLFLLILLYTISEPWFLLILSRRMKFRFKIIYSALTFGLITNLFFIAMNMAQQRNLIKDVCLDFTNQIHLMAKSSDMDLQYIEQYKDTYETILVNVLKKAQSRKTNESTSNSEITLNSVTVFDKDFKPVKSITREEEYELVQRRMLYDNITEFEEYYRDIVYDDLIKKIQENGLSGETNYGEITYQDDSLHEKITKLMLGFSVFIQPIYFNNFVVGYYGAEINTRLFGGEIMYNFLSALLLLPVFLLFYFFLFSITGRWITGHLNTLLQHTNDIKKGDFSQHAVINSGDEIEDLSENFESMREKLKENIDEISKKNKNLTELTDSLEIMVEMRTKELKEAHVKLAESIKKLEELSITDPLTGIYNRRHFNSIAALEFKKAFRNKTNFSIIMMDIDNFKKVNDTYGHPVGDEVLVAVAKAVKGTAKRPGDVVARYGGEEIIVLLEGTNLEGAKNLAEEMRTAIEKITVSVHAVKPTASFGVYSDVPTAERPFEEYVKAADDGLYKAKHNGKNQVCSIV